MKRFLSLMLALILALGCVTAVAEAWNCESCGASNSAKFCTECGAKRPEAKCAGCGYQAPSGKTFKFCPECGLKAGSSAAPAATPTPRPAAEFAITDVTVRPNGDVQVSWQDPDNRGPYTVLYECYVNDTLTGPDQQKQLRFTGESDVAGTTATLNRLIPGRSYWILVRNADGEYASYAHVLGYTMNFVDFDVAISKSYRVSINDQVSEISGLSASTMASSDDTYGMRVDLKYDKRDAALTHVGRVAICTPDGTILQVTYIEDFSISEGSTGTYWEIYNLNTAVKNAKTMYGHIPTGTWTWTLYFDNECVGSMDFYIGD